MKPSASRPSTSADAPPASSRQKSRRASSATCNPNWSTISSRASPAARAPTCISKTMYGRSNHHKIEALFKAFARALRVACSRDKQLGEMLPSTKGLL